MNKWMKVISGIIVATALVTILAGVALAQGPDGGRDGVPVRYGAPLGQGRGYAWGFVDEDGDGINDRHLSCPQFVDEDGDGVCDLCGSAAHGFSHGDGTCDNHPSGTRTMGRGSRYGR
jgi:hypothetical protein